MILTARFTILASVGLLLHVSYLPAQSPTSADPLIGIWASETIFGPARRGELTVTRDGSNWRAAISSVETRFQANDDSIRFMFPATGDQFRGVLTPDRKAIKGFWIQANGSVTEVGPHDRGGLDQALATPLMLRLRQRDVWRANIAGLPPAFLIRSENSFVASRSVT